MYLLKKPFNLYLFYSMCTESHTNSSYNYPYKFQSRYKISLFCKTAWKLFKSAKYESISIPILYLRS